MLFLYFHAYRLRDALELSALERLDTRFAIYRIIALVAIGLIAALFARLEWFHQWGGLIYLSLFQILRFSRILHRRRRAPLLAETAAR